MRLKFKYLENNVLSDKKYEFPYYFAGEDVKKAELRVMFIGNSITIHQKKLSIGWKKECGMAASDLEHDYVHLVLKHIQSIEPSTNAMIVNGGDFERNFEDKYALWPITQMMKMYLPEITIIRIGENFNQESIKNGVDPYFALNELVKAANKYGNVVITSLFWKNEVIDSAIKRVAEENEIEYYIDISDLGDNEENMAIGVFKNPDVSRHPNDLGMQRIADRINEILNDDDDDE